MSDTSAKNTRVLVMLCALVAGMVGLSFAAVPLYRIFCQVTGYGGTTQTVVNSYDIPILAREVKVSFNADHAPDLPWSFEPVQRRVTVKLGEEALVYFRARNFGDQPITGTAVFNVTPFKAGPFFSKIECFCFTEQTLAPGEEVEMPVTFFVDPAMDEDKTLKDVREITLSYTFFRAKE
ncbi:MAG: cytochrome c oxidase assembly protein [Alphaproteobacteria bacterium]|nr:MAG: cytochrome c oxidase assembly protein [Alphaproteobacteria bacterium]